MKASKKKVKNIPVDFNESEETVANSENEELENQEQETTKETTSGAEVPDSADTEESPKAEESADEKYQNLNDQFLRLRAEFVNYKKRVEREKIEFSTYLKSEIFRQILPVLDDFDHMLKHSDENSSDESILEGAKIIREKLMSAMAGEGLKQMDALNTEFDPEYHEAMMMQKTEKENEHNKVITVFQEGYMLNERMVRPAKVIVGNYES